MPREDVAGRTVAEIAESIGTSEETALGYLLDFAGRGIAEEIGGRWRLTRRAELEFGLALREIEDGAA